MNAPVRRLRARSAAGFTLVEVLVTLVIFAFGMLGVAALQMLSLTNILNPNGFVTALQQKGYVVEKPE